MEEVEAGLLEGGIGWLAETILENLDTDKLGEWIRQVGLADDTEKLRSEIERVEMVVAAVKGRVIGNRSLARSLGRLREVLYDADDAVDELDYYRLQQQVQGDAWQGATESLDEHGAEQAERPSSSAAIASSNGSKKRSKAWGHHLTSTTTTLCRRTSSLNPHKMYGRDAEKNAIMKIITDESYDGVAVVPIVDIGGVGKTALAQLAYNDPIMKCDFVRIWVWVSDSYDELRLTMEILDFVSQEIHEESPQRKESYKGVSSFAKLQEILNGYMGIQSKKFLLILDDVWDNMDDYRWNILLAPLKSNRTKGNMILVTTRILSLAQRVGTVQPIKLDALSKKDFWLYFKACAFGDENYEAHPSLNIIGQKIADKLNGNPFAEQTAGRLLRKHLTVDHWSNILADEDWKSLHITRGIMLALKISYDQLPYHLQQCFLYCSIFPSK